jgi:hypothetical protein
MEEGEIGLLSSMQKGMNNKKRGRVRWRAPDGERTCNGNAKISHS